MAPSKGSSFSVTLPFTPAKSESEPQPAMNGLLRSSVKNNASSVVLVMVSSDFGALPSGDSSVNPNLLMSRGSGGEDSEPSLVHSGNWLAVIPHTEQLIRAHLTLVGRLHEIGVIPAIPVR